MRFTSLFVENFLNILGVPIGSMSIDTAGTSTLVTTTSSVISSLSDGLSKVLYGDSEDSTLGTTSIYSATTTITTTLEALTESIIEYEITQAYVESLDEEELTELIGMLDEKEKDFEEQGITLTLENHDSI